VSHDSNISQGAGHFEARRGFVKRCESSGHANAARESKGTRGWKPWRHACARPGFSATQSRLGSAGGVGRSGIFREARKPRLNGRASGTPGTGCRPSSYTSATFCLAACLYCNRGRKSRFGTRLNETCGCRAEVAEQRSRTRRGGRAIRAAILRDALLRCALPGSSDRMSLYKAEATRPRCACEG
jgi:hypothetical protein